MFARVIVDIKHSDIDRVFDYQISENDVEHIKKGMRVLVPFGVQTRMGIVTEIIEESSLANKEIIAILDDEPTVDEELFLLVDHMYQNSLNLISEVFETAVPKQLWMQYEKKVKLLKRDEIGNIFKDKFNKQGIWHLKPKEEIYLARLKKLEKQGIVSLETDVKQKSSEKISKYVRLLKRDYEPTNAQFETFNHLLQVDEISLSELKNLTGYDIKPLIKRGVVEVYDKVIDRETKHYFELLDTEITLTDEQIRAFEFISQQLETDKTVLLEGVTGSGKTEIYVRLIEKLLRTHKKVLILVPEIMLVGPMAKRIKSHFEDANIALYHSDMADGIKFDCYQKIRKNQVDIVIGTRSAIFLPIKDLGVIVIDEEHDSSYMQTEGVYYDTRVLARIKGSYQGFPVLLASATPSIESKYLAETKKYAYVELKQRALDVKLPKVNLVDMTLELKRGNHQILSKSLKKAIDEALDKNEQVMLLMNQKGYAPFVMCRNCGHVIKDPKTQTSLVYYKDDNVLKSKYSSYEEPFIKCCPLCKKDTLKPVGVGIEYVEEALKKIYPSQNILRMDAHTTAKRGTHERLWQDFLDEKAQILLGTQMIAKGLDFPKLTVVGILMADAQLKVPTYDAYEKAYMLFTQAIGRAGRHKPGSVYIQAYDINHYIIDAAQKHDYQAFYEKSLVQRKLMSLKPFGFMHQLMVSGGSYLKTYQYAFALKKALEKEGMTVLGPKVSLILKRQDKYRFLLTFKYEKEIHDLNRLLKPLLNHEYYVQFFYEPNEI